MAVLGEPVAPPGMAAVSLDISSLPPDARARFEEYRKIVQFRDEVLSGAHPRIKPASTKPGADESYSSPSSSALKSGSSASSGPQATMLNGNAQVVDNSQSYQANAQRVPVKVSPAFPGLGMLPGSNADNASNPFAPGKPEINPVLLEKSEDLIKAEIHLHRLRLERSLKEQIDQKRAAAKALQQAPESLSDLDLTDVFSRAMILAQATAARPTDDTAANPSNESDFFDDNTFYSSRHDTPETPQISRVANESEDEQMREDSYEPQLDSPPVVPAQNPLANEPPSPARDPPPRPIPASYLASAQAPAPRGPSSYLPGVSNTRVEGLQAAAPIELTSSDGSGPASRSEESVIAGPENTANQGSLYRVNNNLLGQALHRQDSPLVRAHNLSPIAPQPEHVSPLAVSRQPPIVQEDASARQATPAQVAALRQQASTGTTPESSPQGSRNERKKKKKKKRADRLAAEAAAQSPYIKPEPRSPSPLNAPPYSRPHKRQRPNHPQQPSPNYDEPGSAGGPRRTRYSLRGQNREDRDSSNGNYVDFAPGSGQPIDVDDPRYDGGYAMDPRPSYGGPLGGTASYTTPYGQEPRTARDAAPYAYDQRDGSRATAHPAVIRDRSRSPIYDRPAATMAPPRVPAAIIVDEFGREYMEPSRPATMLRETVMSGTRVGDSELRYERAPGLRAASQRPDTFEQDGVLYQRVSPNFVGPPRRVITHGEPAAATEYRAYQDREYSVRPMAPPGDDYGVQRTRVVTDTPREYITRASSVRPTEGVRYETTVGYEKLPIGGALREYIPGRAASVRPIEGLRYEMPIAYERRVRDEPAREYGSVRASSVLPAGYEVVRDYSMRLGTSRPEVPHREYAASAHPEARRDTMPLPPEARPYSVRPFEAVPPQVVRQDYSVRPVEQYYARPPPRQDEDVVYLEHPSQGSYH